MGRSGATRQIAGLSTNNNLSVLRSLFMELKPVRTLEIGLAFGGSTLLMTSCHQELRRVPSHQHTAIDPFQATEWDETGIIAVEQAGLAEFLDFRGEYSNVTLPQLSAEKASFGLVYIDGSHLFEDVFMDFYYAFRVLADGGVIAFDDSTDPHVNKVLKFITANFGSALQLLDLTPHRPASQRTLRYHAARWLGRTQLTAFRKVGPSTRAWDSSFHNF